jgi:hypothetical protein
MRLSAKQLGRDRSWEQRRASGDRRPPRKNVARPAESRHQVARGQLVTAERHQEALRAGAGSCDRVSRSQGVCVVTRSASGARPAPLGPERRVAASCAATCGVLCGGLSCRAPWP